MLKSFFKKFIEKIPPHFGLLIKLYALNLSLFLIFRLFFYYFNHSEDTGSVPFFDKLWAFRMGLEFDTAVFCWIVYLPMLIWSLAAFLKKPYFIIYRIGLVLFLILISLYYFIWAADIPYFSQFGTHLNKNALLWNENPGFVVGMIFGNFSYWGFLILFFIITFIGIHFTNRFYKTFRSKLEAKSYPGILFLLLFFVFLTGLTTIGARGRTSDRSGLHEGLSIVSENNFINQVAINPNFTFWKSTFYDRAVAYKAPDNIGECIDFTKNYLGVSLNTKNHRSIDRIVTDTLKNKYNFVIVVMESMSVFKMGYYNGKKLTPHLDSLIQESVFFNNFFSSGIHTFNGLFSTTSGYPSIYAEKSMKSYVKQSFSGLGPMLKDLGYETYFYTTHDPHFDNMQGFFKLNKFDHFISQYDFDFLQAESSLGVPDHVLLDKLVETINTRKTNAPFAAVLMTASDHGPWKIPQDIPFKPNSGDEHDDCTLYADWSIGRFMAQAKKLPWYKNTVFMFLGDHGLSMGHTYEMPISYNHVPFVIHQPSILKADTISSPAYQPDVPATVMGIIGASYTDNTFGLNVLKYKHPFVVFSADDK
ncbi:MAG: sulfatase, partial [Bacteroidetes bacterium]|nr:sulfatase [Bacteroidota bacterium]